MTVCCSAVSCYYGRMRRLCSTVCPHCLLLHAEWTRRYTWFFLEMRSPTAQTCGSHISLKTYSLLYLHFVTLQTQTLIYFCGINRAKRKMMCVFRFWKQNNVTCASVFSLSKCTENQICSKYNFKLFVVLCQLWTF